MTREEEPLLVSASNSTVTALTLRCKVIGFPSRASCIRFHALKHARGFCKSSRVNSMQVSSFHPASWEWGLGTEQCLYFKGMDKHAIQIWAQGMSAGELSLNGLSTMITGEVLSKEGCSRPQCAAGTKLIHTDEAKPLTKPP